MDLEEASLTAKSGPRGFPPKWILLSMRPTQWTKNLLVYFAYFFTINLRWEPSNLGTALTLLGDVTLAFLLLCLLSGATYLINDLADLEQDRQHPRKRQRPLASGRLGHGQAKVAAGLLVAAAIPLSYLLHPGFGVVAFLYFLLSVAYSLWLRRVVIIDVMAISAGFVLRAAAGALVIGVIISPWLYVVTSLGALFLTLAKRRGELAQAGPNSSQRPTLQHYTMPFLDQLIAVVTPATLVAYILYTFTAANLPQNRAMMLTIPFVVYGLFRYLYLVHRQGAGERPEEILLTDIPIILTLVLWLIASVNILLVFRAS